MDWPRTPVDRLQDFRPPFCPRRDCSHHRRSAGFRYRKHSPYSTRTNPRVPRFRCNLCGSVFSRRPTKAVSLSHWAWNSLYFGIAHRLV